MAGIGKYTKGAKFTLKSGNSPAFKMVGNTEAGDSPITNEFGIGKGASPYRHKAVTGTRHEHMEGGKKVLHGPSGKVVDEAEWEAAGAEERGKGQEGMKEKYASEYVPTDDKGGADDKESKKGGKFWQRKDVQVGLAALTGGLDAVYGSGKILPAGSPELIKKKKKKDDDDDTETEARTISQEIIKGETTEVKPLTDEEKAKGLILSPYTGKRESPTDEEDFYKLYE